ncbi:MAG TPA: penicillin-binding protein activator [Burkholderiales bacterium]|nr:penicillin-binding protein activator [Burkholderiales bacterium]
MRCGVSHRWLVVPLIAAILYGRATAIASEVVVAPAPPPPSLGEPIPLPESGAGPLILPPLSPAAPAAPPSTATPPDAPGVEPPTPTAADPVPQPAVASVRPDPYGVPHIALILPLKSATFGRPAEAVRSGFLAAAKVQGSEPLPLRVYAVGDDPAQTVASYATALAGGARLVVGPLTRNGVTAIAGNPVPIPTLALNVPDTGTTVPLNLYMLSLQAESEAQQVAQLAFRDGWRKVLVVSADNPLMRRIQQAFADEFARLGGVLVAEYAFTSDPEGLARIKEAAGLGVADSAFLALDFPQARLARPYLDPLAIYATSHVNPGRAGPLAGYDLAGVRFLDMPWLLQPEHPAVMIYPRLPLPDAADHERFYALGIDAFRIAVSLLADAPEATLDGVTGRIRLEPNQQFVRTLTAAQFTQGKLTVTGTDARGLPR